MVSANAARQLQSTVTTHRRHDVSICSALFTALTSCDMTSLYAPGFTVCAPSMLPSVTETIVAADEVDLLFAFYGLGKNRTIELK